MVTGSTDNGSYFNMSELMFADMEHPRADIRLLGVAVLGVGYSRKTARGASSPAKPALHIPELGLS